MLTEWIDLENEQRAAIRRYVRLNDFGTNTHALFMFDGNKAYVVAAGTEKHCLHYSHGGKDSAPCCVVCINETT